MGILEQMRAKTDTAKEEKINEEKSAAEKAAADAAIAKAQQDADLATRAARALRLDTTAAAFKEFAGKRAELIQSPENKFVESQGELDTAIKEYESVTGEAMGAADKSSAFSALKSEKKQETKGELIDTHKQMKAIGEELKGMMADASEEEQIKIREALASADPEVLKAKRAEIAEATKKRTETVGEEAEVKKLIDGMPTLVSTRAKELQGLFRELARTNKAFRDKALEYAKSAGFGKATEKGGTSFSQEEMQKVVANSEQDILKALQERGLIEDKDDFEKSMISKWRNESVDYYKQKRDQAKGLGETGKRVTGVILNNAVSALEDKFSDPEIKGNESIPQHGPDDLLKLFADDIDTIGDKNQQRQMLTRVESLEAKRKELIDRLSLNDSYVEASLADPKRFPDHLANAFLKAREKLQ